MKIKYFRIKNYRSIRDSGICYLSGDNITILAGKNESGKTSILEALEDFNIEKPIREEAIPQQDDESIPKIIMTFEMDKTTLKSIASNIQLKISETKNVDIEIVKIYPNSYSLTLEGLKKIGFSDVAEREVINTENKFFKLFSKFTEISENLPSINDMDIETYRTKIIDLWSINQNKLIIISNEDKNEINDRYNQLFEKIKELLDLNYKITTEIKKSIPNFILFSSFDDIFPSVIPFTEAMNNELIKDLAIISDLNMELIKSSTPNKKAKHKEKLNIQLRNDYKEYWSQDSTEIFIDWEAGELHFFIKESGEFFNPNKRSKGKQWHLAFYVKVTARSKEDKANIILIDEPGLFLHAKAQEDILKKLDDSAKNTPVIFSTHSPYLIEVDKLSRIRLISRTEEEGTVISNKIHKNADKETLTPIITAIGLDLSMGLDIAKNNNIIVEGISDFYYLSAFKELLNFKFKKDVHFIPSGGADKFKFLIPLMIGWGLNYCTVLDNDNKGRIVEKDIVKNFGSDGVNIIKLSRNKDDEIEDLFDRNDFIKYVLGEKSNELPADKTNSQILKLKDNGYDKVLLSKLFYESVSGDGIDLIDETTQNFKSLLEEIDKTLFLNV